MSFPRLKDVEGTWNNLNSLILKQLSDFFSGSGNGATEETVYQYLFFLLRGCFVFNWRQNLMYWACYADHIWPCWSWSHLKPSEAIPRSEGKNSSVPAASAASAASSDEQPPQQRSVGVQRGEEIERTAPRPETAPKAKGPSGP